MSRPAEKALLALKARLWPFVLPTDMAHRSGVRPNVKEEEGSYGYALEEGLAAEFERAAETKARTGTGTQYPIRKQRRWLTLW